VTRFRPQFSFLLQPETAPAEVTYLRTFTNGAATVVYRING
jgi:hypothetical protein